MSFLKLATEILEEGFGVITIPVIDEVKERIDKYRPEEL